MLYNMHICNAFLFLFVTLVVCTLGQKNNVCRTMEDYFTIHKNKNCWYDYASDKEVPDIIIKGGRPFEEHKAVTSDGHILTLFRIPNKESPNRKLSPVFLQHGLLSSALHWVSLGNDSLASLAFQLHNHGYDVWLGNCRGSRYSDQHTIYTVDDEEYWDHTADDLAMSDFPAMLDKVNEVTGHTGHIIYLGHSLGGTMSLMFAAEYPQIAKSYMKANILVAPAYELRNMISPSRFVLPISGVLWDTAHAAKSSKLVSYGKISNGLTNRICMTDPGMMFTCFRAFNLFYGTQTSIKPNQVVNYVRQHFAGASMKVTYHLVQFISSQFTKFNYGVNNTKIYGQPIPPLYDVSKIEVPTLLFYARQDWLTSKLDQLQLLRHLNKQYVYGVEEMPSDNFNHMDFVFGSTAKVDFVDKAIKYIETLNKI